ncbi:N-6 DNA methylase [Candidatus Marinamargulisbacteria bacterium]|nr:N-6 DNA methylase [Candidatus Marinamargulisbacteria bacterium]
MKKRAKFYILKTTLFNKDIIMVKRKNETKVDIDLFNYLKDEREFLQTWNPQKQDNIHIQEILDTSSKKGTGNHGYPDFIYVNEYRKLLILIENKDSISDHSSDTKNKADKFAVDGILHYLNFFLSNSISNYLEPTQKYLKDWNIVGIAFSGDIKDKYNHLISTFIIIDNKIEEQNIKEILNESDYLSLFENLDLELISNNISKSSKEINNLLRNIDSQKRPILLSALMICLYERKNIPNDFKTSYQNWQTQTILGNITNTVNGILISENISQDKIDILINELAFVKTDKDINDTEIIKEILIELENNVIPLFNKKSNYDIIGKFYEEFLRFAGVSNVKKGIVLTPNHITNLFTKLIDLRVNDVILDPCCGSGAFLIAGMNKLVDIISKSSIADKSERINNIKQNQLIGFEKSNTMFTLAISNMLFRGDGKSKIFNVDFFSQEADSILENINPTVGFINPPYGGSDNKKNPTKKEIQFLERMLDNVSRYGVIIAPMSTYFKENTTRERILSKHTLKYVINMPSELFQPNASTLTAIAVFETHLPHDNKEVVFYDLVDDGFVLSKHRGRMDMYNKWNNIESDFIDKINDPKQYSDNKTLVHCNISGDDEWVIQAHSITDYSLLKKQDFTINIKRDIIFSVKSRLGILDEDIDEITLSEVMVEYISSDSMSDKTLDFDITRWKEFNYGGKNGIFDIYGGYYNKKPEHVIDGDIPFIGASKAKNGITEFYSKEDIERCNKDTNSKQHNIDEKIFKPNCITVANNGSAGSAFFQESEFTCSHDVNILYLKNKEMNKFVAIFLCTVIKLEKFRWDFGRKWRPIRMPKSKIKLPVTSKGEPDWQFMEDYIKSLPYSSNL